MYDDDHQTRDLNVRTIDEIVVSAKHPNVKDLNSAWWRDNEPKTTKQQELIDLMSIIKGGRSSDIPPLKPTYTPPVNDKDPFIITTDTPTLVSFLSEIAHPLTKDDFNETRNVLDQILSKKRTRLDQAWETRKRRRMEVISLPKRENQPTNTRSEPTSNTLQSETKPVDQTEEKSSLKPAVLDSTNRGNVKRFTPVPLPKQVSNQAPSKVNHQMQSSKPTQPRRFVPVPIPSKVTQRPREYKCSNCTIATFTSEQELNQHMAKCKHKPSSL